MKHFICATSPCTTARVAQPGVRCLSTVRKTGVFDCKSGLLANVEYVLSGFQERPESEFTPFPSVRYHRKCALQNIFPYYPTGWHDKRPQLECVRHALCSNTGSSPPWSDKRQSEDPAATESSRRKRHHAVRPEHLFKPFKPNLPGSSTQG